MEVRETFESGLVFGRRTLEALGVADEEALAITNDIRRRDEARLNLQAAEGLAAGRDMLHSRPVRPEPLIKPKHTEQIADEEDDLIVPETQPAMD